MGKQAFIFEQSSPKGQTNGKKGGHKGLLLRC